MPPGHRWLTLHTLHTLPQRSSSGPTCSSDTLISPCSRELSRFLRPQSSSAVPTILLCSAGTALTRAHTILLCSAGVALTRAHTIRRFCGAKEKEPRGRHDEVACGAIGRIATPTRGDTCDLARGTHVVARSPLLGAPGYGAWARSRAVHLAFANSRIHLAAKRTMWPLVARRWRLCSCVASKRRQVSGKLAWTAGVAVVTTRGIHGAAHRRWNSTYLPSPDAQSHAALRVAISAATAC